MISPSMAIHIGTSGWSYNHWEGVLYPPGLPVKDRLAVYVEHFRTVELNASYYHWPRENTFKGWANRLPEAFKLSVKAPGVLTHQKRLYEPEEWCAHITRCLVILGDKLGVLLVQTPPDFAYDPVRLKYFLTCIPKDLRVALEFRHPSWHTERTFACLESHGAAYCVMSGARLPCILKATGDFVYVRLHGPDHSYLYAGSYPDEDLAWWAERIHEWSQAGKDVYVYFNNDGAGNAVRNSRRLIDLVST